jgi:hypothetical protein
MMFDVIGLSYTEFERQLVSLLEEETTDSSGQSRSKSVLT